MEQLILVIIIFTIISIIHIAVILYKISVKKKINSYPDKYIMKEIIEKLKIELLENKGYQTTHFRYNWKAWYFDKEDLQIKEKIYSDIHDLYEDNAKGFIKPLPKQAVEEREQFLEKVNKLVGGRE